MVQLNLLPDIKQQYIKARRTKRLVIVISVIASAASLFVFLLALVTVDVVQKKSMNDLKSDISTNSSRLRNTKDLDKILTVQNQLNTLTSLHDQKVVASRLFGYASKITPSNVTISSLNVDFVGNTIAITGEAPNLDAINVYADTLKATTYTTDTDKTGSKKAFSNVVLSSFGRDSKGATYSVTLSFDPAIFSGQQSINLTVPNGIQSNITKLFEQQAEK